MPQMDLGVRVAMVALVVLMIVAIVFYHVWLDHLQQRGRERADRRKAETTARVVRKR